MNLISVLNNSYYFYAAFFMFAAYFGCLKLNTEV